MTRAEQRRVEREQAKAVEKWRKQARQAQLRAERDPSHENLAAVHTHLALAKMLGLAE